MTDAAPPDQDREGRGREQPVALENVQTPSNLGMSMLVVGFVMLLGAVGLMVVLVIRWAIGLAS